MEKIMKYSLLCCAIVLFAQPAQAAIHTEIIKYKDGGVPLEGFLAYDDTSEIKRPGIIVVHDWMGFGPYANDRAKQLAELGYVALAIDIYGEGVRPKNKDEASQQASIYKNDRQLLRQRARRGYELLRSQKLVDDTKLAAIGYCFGGTTVLEMARSGMDLQGVVSFHGGLSTPNPDDSTPIQAHILVLHGGDDPYVPPAEVVDFQKEMNRRGADWQMKIYSGAVHAFTQKSAGNDNSKGAAYNEKADKRSWEEMKIFFKEIF